MIILIKLLFGIPILWLGVKQAQKTANYSDENAFSNGYFRKSNGYTIAICLILLGLLIIFTDVLIIQNN